MNTRCCLFKIFSFFVHNNPEAEAQRSYAYAALNYNEKRTPVQTPASGLL